MAVVSALAATVMIVVIVAAASARRGARSAHESTPTSSTAIPAIASTAPTTLAPTTTSRPRTTLPARTLAEGASGADVLALQSASHSPRLLAPRRAGNLRSGDGTRGGRVREGNRLRRDGIVDAAEGNKLRSARRFKPRSTTGRVFEVDLQRQLLLDVDNGRVTWAFDTSTGRIPGTTPSGHFPVYQQVDGWVHGTLGTLYRPKFFAGNVGIHGSPSIPPYPASHGCVRMFNAAMDWIWASGDLPMGTEVWVY